MGIPAKVSLTNGFPAPMQRELDARLPWTGELPRAMVDNRGLGWFANLPQLKS